MAGLSRNLHDVLMCHVSLPRNILSVTSYTILISHCLTQIIHKSVYICGTRVQRIADIQG